MLHIILLIKNSLQQQIHFNGNIFGNKCCRCIEGSLYMQENDMFITKTRLCNFDPLKPHFYIVKLGFTGVYILFFLFLLKNIDYGYSLEPPLRGGSNKYPQSMFWAEIWKIFDFFWLKIFNFSVINFSVYLNRHVFVMLYIIHVKMSICMQKDTIWLWQAAKIQISWLICVVWSESLLLTLRFNRSYRAYIVSSSTLTSLQRLTSCKAYWA